MIFHIVAGCLCLVAMFVCFAADSAGFGVLMFGLTIMNFGFAHVDYKENEEAKQEKIVVTSTPPQIDTTITVFNGVADTIYTYHFPPDGMVN